MLNSSFILNHSQAKGGGSFGIDPRRYVDVCRDIDSFPIAQFPYSLVEIMFAIAFVMAGVFHLFCFRLAYVFGIRWLFLK